MKMRQRRSLISHHYYWVFGWGYADHMNVKLYKEYTQFKRKMK